MKKLTLYILASILLTVTLASSGYCTQRYFRAQHWIVGEVHDDPSGQAEAEGRPIVLYFPLDPMNFSESIIGLAGPAAQANKYMINAYGIQRDIVWMPGDILEARSPCGPDGYGTAAISFETTGAGFDIVPVLTLEALGLAIEIRNVRFDGVPHASYAGAVNIIAPRPLIEANIDVNMIGSYVVSVEVLYNGGLFDQESDPDWEGKSSILFSKQLTQEIPQGDGTISIRAWTDGAEMGQKDLLVSVMGKGVPEVIGYTLAYPSPYKPLTHDRLRISYHLSVDSNIKFVIIDTAGKHIFTRNFMSGENGGRLGYNEIEWNGVMDPGGIVGNGIYVYSILSGNKKLATGKIVVFE